ncbi:hypothetical protein PHSY_005933 [Pseudozyma hubeiensis SY62]|uniref:F-box domain-containing protein n=1 Tax=Pseudozyma hubeiensis (strain SY62) TaxID=1305764 RepID=R9PJT5_PSEHS|nr:hypothetical protein PHSY_005933 [Pseudozyma hubeiensis SY62]GAC98340.1 hypothetical protein PHSY_005933 [Pseudozyma hubeiensis SY62]
MDPRLADETILRIFSLLDAPDLARLQLVSKQVRTLAKDRHLWKRLFYCTFVRPQYGGSRKHATSSTLPALRELRSLLLHQNLLTGKHVAGDGNKQIHRLPSRYYRSSSNLASGTVPEGAEANADEALSALLLDGLASSETSKNHLLDWEQIFRVSTNWQRGNFAVSVLSTISPPVARQTEKLHPPSSTDTIVRVSDRFIFTAASGDRGHIPTNPSVSVYRSEPDSASLDQHDGGAGQVPSDLHKRSPDLRFTSAGMQDLLDSNNCGNTLAQIRVTEIAVDNASSENRSPVEPSRHRKRRWEACDRLHSEKLARVLVAYTTGHISLFSLKAVNGSVIATEDIFCRPAFLAIGDCITMAALDSPAVVLCSSKFDVAFYQIAQASSTTRLDLVHRLSSYRCSWPASLRLKKLPYHHVSKRLKRSSSLSSTERHGTDDRLEEVAFRVTLAYSTPCYPSSWSVSVQEVVLRLRLDATSTSAVQVTSRHATAKHPFRPTPIDPRGRLMLGGNFMPSSHAPRDASGQRKAFHSSLGPASSRSTSLTYDDPFVVLGASDNLVEVYELVGATTFVRTDTEERQAHTSTSRSATATPASHRQGLRLVHRRSLHGHTGSVHSVALEDGRCVSGGADGSVMVWSLGERSSETESIASAMRRARATALGAERREQSKHTSARSTSSTLLEEDGEEAAIHMSHVLTLRSPTISQESEVWSLDDDVACQSTPTNARRFGPSLGQLVGSRLFDRQARGVIRWVSTAFDKIVSIVAYTEATSNSANAGIIPIDGQQPRERVQLWSFR